MLRVILICNSIITVILCHTFGCNRSPTFSVPCRHSGPSHTNPTHLLMLSSTPYPSSPLSLSPEKSEIVFFMVLFHTYLSYLDYHRYAEYGLSRPSFFIFQIENRRIYYHFHCAFVSVNLINDLNRYILIIKLIFLELVHAIDSATSLRPSLLLTFVCTLIYTHTHTSTPTYTFIEGHSRPVTQAVTYVAGSGICMVKNRSVVS